MTVTGVSSYGPTTWVDQPAPLEPRFHLLKAAQVDSGVDNRWGNGAEQWPYYDSSGLATFDPCDEDSDPMVYGAPLPIPTIGAFQVVLPVSVTAVQVVNPDVFRKRLLTLFEAIEHKAVETELELGTARDTANPHLNDADCTILDSSNVTALNATEGLAQLELAIGASGHAGMIHATRTLVARWSQDYVLHQEGSGGSAKLYTAQGTQVVPGDGYSGVGPGGVQLDEIPNPNLKEYAYATGMVEILRDPQPEMFPMKPVEGMDRTLDTMYFAAVRTYLINFDRSIHVAVQIDRSI